MAPVYLESAHAYASQPAVGSPAFLLNAPVWHILIFRICRKGGTASGALRPGLGGLSFASLLSVNLLSAAHEWRSAPDALRLPHRPSQGRLSPSWSPRSLPPNFSPRDSWTLSKKPRRMRRLLASTPAFARKTVNLRHVAINKQPIAPRPLLLTRERLPPL